MHPMSAQCPNCTWSSKEHIPECVKGLTRVFTYRDEDDPKYLHFEDSTNPIFLIDFYKFGHVDQYPKNIRKVWVNFTPRSTRVEGETGVVFFGLQRFIKKILLEQFNENFFSRSWEKIEAEYIRVIKKTLGVTPRTDHIKQLHQHGKLPIKIYALPEGTYVPLGVPAMVIVNTEDWAFWLPNYLETMMSNNLWHGCTSASTALRYRRLFIRHAKLAGETDLGFIDWMGHDFSYRGLEGLDGAVMSGMGHLLSFNGTDTLPAILEAEKYYNADLSIGGSVPATEHSVMCAGSQEGERETFRRLIQDVYPTGIVSIVSDTWDLWKVLTEIVPSLKDVILARDGKVVFRPDSGDPVKILTGDRHQVDGWYETTPQFLGALELLFRALGGTARPGSKERPGSLIHINKAGLIYGDSITVERADQILTNARNQGFSPYNFVFGIGSYTYQYVTRDTYNFAFKATAIEKEIPQSWIVGGDGSDTVRVIEAIFKDPVTDNAHKKSHRGIPVVYLGRVGQGDVAGKLYVEESLNPDDLDRSEFRKVFDGDLLIDENFETIRKRVRDQA
jgi:nicotinamide phosphoribosyltransferase